MLVDLMCRIEPYPHMTGGTAKRVCELGGGFCHPERSEGSQILRELRTANRKLYPTRI